MNHKLFFLLLGLVALAGCASEGGRLKTKSGYTYQFVRKGTAEQVKVGDFVFLHFSLSQKDSVIQSTTDSGKPAVLKAQEDNKNYGDLMHVMDLVNTLHKGDSILFYFPVDSFQRMPPGFEKFTEPMVYHVGVADVMSESDYQAYSDSIQAEQEKMRQVVREREAEVDAFVRTTLESYKKGTLAGQLQTTASGLKYVIHEKGKDGTQTPPGQGVSVHYYGMLESDATMFDNSFNRGEPIQFPLGMGRVIQGWDEGIGLLNKGAKATLFIPPALGYGAAGAPPRIPENAALVFYVEIAD